MTKRTLAVLAVVALMGAGCSGSSSVDIQPKVDVKGSGTVGTDAAANARIAGNWKLMTFKKPAQGLTLQDVDALNLTLTIGTDGKLSAKICNSMSGSYSYEGGKLQAPQMQSTLMFCEGLPGEIEAGFASDLAAGAAAQSGDGGLVIIGGKTGNIYTFAKK